MDPKVNIILLGTGGGRFTTITQKRRTAGIRIISSSLNLHLDPGPGALVHSVNEDLDPQKLDAVFVSHCHPDHYTDAEVLIEAVAQGATRKRGVLAAARSVLHGSKDGFDRVISTYHQQMLRQVTEALPNTSFKIDDVKVDVTETKHSDPDAVGFRFGTAKFGDFAYTSDTEYFEGIAKQYDGVRLLLLCVMRPGGRPWTGHMTTNDAMRIVEQTNPELAVMTHLGMGMIFQDPVKEAKLVEEKTGVHTIAAVDGMRISFGKTIVVQTKNATPKKRFDEIRLANF